MATQKENKFVEKFILNTIKECQDYGVKVKFIKAKTVEFSDGVTCNGYFESDPTLTLCVAVEPSDWLAIFAHESCHFDQWKEKSPIWDFNESCSYVDEWLQGKRVKNIKKHIEQVQELELDCEKRTAKKIAKYNLPIDQKEYIQKANTYIYLYTLIKKTRRWFGLIPPYRNEKIWREAPVKFQKDYSVIPNNLEKLLLDNNINV